MLTLPAPPVTIQRSKIERPSVSGQWVRRPQIETRLDRALERSLTVIAAPAGHGKTSTIVTWLRLRDLDAAWMTVDDRDVELTRFATHVAATLDRFAPGSAASCFAMLAAPDRLAPRDFGEAFGDRLYDLEQDVLLILDDLHEAGSDAVTAFVAGLLRAAPRRLHTILSSRSNPPFPMSRLRIAGDVEELTGADHRFSPLETSELLRLESGEDAAPQLAASVQESVGGWPAAIKLVALGRFGHDGAPPVAMGGERPEQLLLAYLGDEVLARLPPSQRELLLWASLLERFNASLLEALAADRGRRITRADLDHLRSLELYREIPGLSETWFALHPLFRDVLRRELERTTSSAAIADLRRGAARWFAEEGLTQDAIAHLVGVADIAAAAALIEARLSAAFAREDWQSVASWLRLIPADAIRNSPELLLASAWVAYLSGRDAGMTEVAAILRDPRLRHLVTPAQQAEIALLTEWPSDESATVPLVEHAIAHMPPHKRYRYGYAHLALAMALTSTGRGEETLARLAAFTARESARIDAASIRGYFGRVVVLWQAGRLVQCEQVAADLLQLAQMNALPLSAGWGAAFLGFVAHERGDLVQPTRHFSLVIAGAERLHFMCVRDTFFVQILAYCAQGLQSEAERAIARLRELVIAAETLHQLDLVDAFVARIALIQGDLSSAQRWLATSAPALEHDDLKAIEHRVLTRAKVLVAVGARDALAEADRLLAAFVSAARTQHMTLALIEGLAVQALLHEASGDRAAATRLLRASLDLAAPEGIVRRYAYLGPALAPILRRLLAERVPRPRARRALVALEALLAAQPAAARASEARGGDHPQTPLTARELEVLRFLALRLTNNEIGEELFISPITVKHHVEHIADKLAVSGRRAVVARATELGLIE
jgi:LuxR family maltose regulon positive regulatory protein